MQSYQKLTLYAKFLSQLSFTLLLLAKRMVGVLQEPFGGRGIVDKPTGLKACTYRSSLQVPAAS